MVTSLMAWVRSSSGIFSPGFSKLRSIDANAARLNSCFICELHWHSPCWPASSIALLRWLSVVLALFQLRPSRKKPGRVGVCRKFKPLRASMMVLAGSLFPEYTFASCLQNRTMLASKMMSASKISPVKGLARDGPIANP